MPALGASAAPIALLLVLMLGLRWPAAKAASCAAAAAALLAVLVLGYGGDGVLMALVGPTLEALFQTVLILWIIFPALCIHELQTRSGAIDLISRRLAGLSPDPRVTALLIGWFFVLFLEGAAGFGTPVALAAPLLARLGFTPVQALTLALVGNVAAVPFGALGTPIAALVATTGAETEPLALAVLLLGAAVEWALAVLLVLLARESGQSIASSFGYALLAAALFFVPALLLAAGTGIELPGIGGAMLGGAAFVLVIRALRRRAHAPGPAAHGGLAALAIAALPYLVIFALVVVTRLVEPLAVRLRAVELHWTVADTFAGSVAPLYHPGMLLTLAAVLAGLMLPNGAARLREATISAARRLPMVALALVSVLTLARLMVHAGMIDTLAAAAAVVFGTNWPLFAPTIGALGSFVTGSATASNILFGDLQARAAEIAAVSTTLVLAAQTQGAAAGNLIAVHNIVAGSATVGLVGEENTVLRRTLPVCLVLVLLLGAAAFIAAHRLGS